MIKQFIVVILSICCVYAAGPSAVKPSAAQKENVVLFDLRCAADHADEVYRVFRGDLYRAFQKSDKYRRVSESDRDNALAGFTEDARKKMTAADAAKAAVSCGAVYAIIGSVTKQDGSYRITVQLLKAIDGEMVREYSESAVTIPLLIEKIRPMVALITGVADDDIRPAVIASKLNAQPEAASSVIIRQHAGILGGVFGHEKFNRYYSPLFGAEYIFLLTGNADLSGAYYLLCESGMAVGNAATIRPLASICYYVLAGSAYPYAAYQFRIGNVRTVIGADVSLGWVSEVAWIEEVNTTNCVVNSTVILPVGGMLLCDIPLSDQLIMYLKVKIDYTIFFSGGAAPETPLFFRFSCGLAF